MTQLIPCSILLFIAYQFVKFLFYEWEAKKEHNDHYRNKPKAYKDSTKEIVDHKKNNNEKVENQRVC